MVRVVLTGLLIAIIAWPHGICFCHSLHALSHHSDVTEQKPSYAGSDSTETPACCAADEDDHHDDECTCCKLRQVLADPIVPILHNTNDDAVAVLPIRLCASGTRTSGGSHHGDQLDSSADQPSPRILCALRI